ncbi:WhiB family transcriptional regulator [Streptomyces sp. DHE17-7]|nr:WhiB family transcriptional regulator [Streptomyces sp. DHE17-7]
MADSLNTDEQAGAVDYALAKRRIAVAKELCAECPFIEPCRDAAMRPNGQAQHGVAGGLTRRSASLMGSTRERNSTSTAAAKRSRPRCFIKALRAFAESCPPRRPSRPDLPGGHRRRIAGRGGHRRDEPVGPRPVRRPPGRHPGHHPARRPRPVRQGEAAPGPGGRPVNAVLERFPASHPRGSWPAEEYAAARRREGIPAEVVMDLATDNFLVITDRKRRGTVKEPHPNVLRCTGHRADPDRHRLRGGRVHRRSGGGGPGPGAAVHRRRVPDDGRRAGLATALPGWSDWPGRLVRDQAKCGSGRLSREDVAD